MIYAKNKDALSYLGIHPNLDMALKHITEEYLPTIGYDRVELKGSDVYATRFTYETVPAEESFFEAHKNYLDIHIMLDGSERVDTILKMSMPWDTMIGVSRRNWAGNPNSMSTVAEYNEMYKGQDHITMPYLADDAVIAEALKSIQA